MVDGRRARKALDGAHRQALGENAQCFDVEPVAVGVLEMQRVDGELVLRDLGFRLLARLLFLPRHLEQSLGIDATVVAVPLEIWTGAKWREAAPADTGPEPPLQALQ